MPEKTPGTRKAKRTEAIHAVHRGKSAYQLLAGKFLSLSEAAEILGVSSRTVTRRCEAGILKRLYDGRTPRICAASVGRYMSGYTKRREAKK